MANRWSSYTSTDGTVISSSFVSDLINKNLEWVSVKDFGVVGDGATDDTDNINAVIEAVGLAGGGTVYFPPGTYMVQDQSGLTGADLSIAITVQRSNVHLVGAGRESTIIKQMDSANRAHVIKIGTRVGTPVTVSNCSVSDLSIDGNRLNISAFSGNCIDVSSGCSRITLERLNIKQAGGYGIGMQRDTFTHCVIRDVHISDTSADGLDWKVDTNSTSYGNIVERVTVLRAGLDVVAIGSSQAGIDVRAGVAVKNCHVGEISSTNVGVRVQLGTNDTAATTLSARSVVENVTILGASTTDTYGLHIGAQGTKVNNVHVSGCQYNYWLRSSSNSLEGISSQGGTHGLYLFSDATTQPSNNTIANALITGGSTNGVVFSGTSGMANNVFVNAIATGNTANVTVSSGTTGTRFIGGSIPATYVDNGTDTVTLGVQGLVTPVKFGRNTTQHVLITGDSVSNNVTGVSVSGTPKSMIVEADANSGDLILRALGASADVRFGTHSAIAAETVTGYIIIKDEAGTSRKLAVVS